MPQEWPQYDDSCAKSCSRSGVAALLLSAFAIAMLPTLTTTESLNALVGYISRRTTLKEASSCGFESDAVWKLLKASDPSAESWDLARLRVYQGRSSPPSAPAAQLAPQDSLAAPTAPTGIAILEPIASIPVIVKTLQELSNRDFLHRARAYNFRYNRLIEPWELQLDEFLVELQGSKGIIGDERTRTDLVLRLPLPKVKELTNFHLPELAEAERLVKEASFTLPSIGIPLNVTISTQLVEVGLLLVTAYFLIGIEKRGPRRIFLPQGAIFGALARSTSSRIMFNLLIMLPPVAAALVAVKTFWLTYLERSTCNYRHRCRVFHSSSRPTCTPTI